MSIFNNKLIDERLNKLTLNKDLYINHNKFAFQYPISPPPVVKFTAGGRILIGDGQYLGGTKSKVILFILLV